MKNAVAEVLLTHGQPMTNVTKTFWLAVGVSVRRSRLTTTTCILISTMWIVTTILVVTLLSPMLIGRLVIATILPMLMVTLINTPSMSPTSVGLFGTTQTAPSG